MSTGMLQSLLMGCGPFYYYPWKCVVNHVAGDSFEVGLKHFKTGHRNGVNLGLHFACLFIQVIGNFALLNAIDNAAASAVPAHIAALRPLSAISAATWSLYMFTTPCSASISMLSTAAIAAGYFAAPHVTPQLMNQFAVVSFLSALTVSNFVISKRPMPLVNVIKAVGFMAAWYFGWPVLENAVAQSAVGAWASSNVTTTIGLVAAYAFGLATLKNPLKPLVLSAVPLLRLAAAATGGNPILFYWSYAFSASLFQGLTHAWTREEATLLALEREEEAAKLRYEWSHVTFFPNLLLQTIADVISSSRNAAEKK